jgi:hypothetical protein
MKRLLVFAAVVVVVASGLLLAQSNPFVGTWKLNLAKSKFMSETPPKGVCSQFKGLVTRTGLR